MDIWGEIDHLPEITGRQNWYFNLLILKNVTLIKCRKK